jgi:hypothetical protein
VFNQDGEAKLTISKEAPCGIRPAWKKRYERLSKHWRKVVERVDKLVSAVDRQSAAQIKSQLLDDDLFEGSFAETDSGCSITYNCKRIGRLSRIRAMGLLMSYTAILARPAYDRPFVDKTSDSTVKS